MDPSNMSWYTVDDTYGHTGALVHRDTHMHACTYMHTHTHIHTCIHRHAESMAAQGMDRWVLSR